MQKKIHHPYGKDEKNKYFRGQIEVKPIIEQMDAIISLLILLVIYDSVLIFVHSLRSMCISDYQLGKIGIYEFVSRYNSYSTFFLVSELIISILSIVTPVLSIMLFVTIFPIFIYEFFLFLKGKLEIEVLWAARTLTKLKIICIAKIILFFIYMIICILKIVSIE